MQKYHKYTNKIRIYERLFLSRYHTKLKDIRHVFDFESRKMNVESGIFLKWERINLNKLNFWYIISSETLLRWPIFQIKTLYIYAFSSLTNLLPLHTYHIGRFRWVKGGGVRGFNHPSPWDFKILNMYDVFPLHGKCDSIGKMGPCQKI